MNGGWVGLLRCPTWRPSWVQLAASVFFAWVEVGVGVNLAWITWGDVPGPVIMAAVVIATGAIMRAPFVGIRVEGSSLVRQSWYWTRRRYPLRTVVEAKVGPYTGWLALQSRWGPSPTAAVTISLDSGKDVELRELYGWASRMHMVAGDMSETLGLPDQQLRTEVRDGLPGPWRPRQ